MTIWGGGRDERSRLSTHSIVASHPFQLRTIATTFGEVVVGVWTESVSGMVCTAGRTLCGSQWFPSRLAMATVCLLFGACAAQAAAAPVLPPGIEQPAGVYASEDEAGCCWTRPRADFVLLQPAHTDRIVVDFVIPPFAVGSKPTQLTLVADGISQSACCYGVGEHQAVFRFRENRGGPRRAHVVLESSSQFVPAQRGLNQDRRVLAVLLKSVTTVSSATGDVYVDGSPVSANLLLPRWRVIFDAIGLGVIAALLVLLLLKRPKYAWMAILAVAPFLLPVPIYGTTISAEKVVIVLAAIMMFAQKRFRAAIFSGPGRWILLALLVFVADMAVSSATAQFHGAALRETLKFAEYALAFGIAYGAYVTDPDDAALQNTLVWIICIVSVLALAQPVVEPVQRTIFEGHILPRIAGPLEGPNQLSAFLGLMLVGLAAAARRYTPGIVMALALGSFALALTISRAGTAAFVFGMALVFALKLWPRYNKTILLSAALICIAFLGVTTLAAATFPNPALDRIFGASDAFNGGLGSRTALWHAALVLWSHHPIFGVGPGNYELLVATLIPGVRTHPNGYFFQILAEQGVIGAILFLLLIATPLKVLLPGTNHRLAVAGIAVIATMTFHQLFDGLLLYPKVGLEYWALIAIGAAASARRDQPPT